jgi:hypothetical protein
MERERGGSGYIPTKKEIRKARGDLTQYKASSMVYTNERAWRNYESGQSRMHPSMWELFLIKVDTVK